MHRLGLDISPGAFICFGFLIYLDPYRLALPFFTACLCHEAGHLLAVRLGGGKVHAIHVRAFGTEMRADCRSLGRELAALIAGPLMNFLLFLLLPGQAERTVNLFLMAFNLLPIPTLDGGRILELVCYRLTAPDRAERIVELTARLVGTLALILGGYGCFLLRWGLWPLTMGAAVAIRAFTVEKHLGARLTLRRGEG